MAARTKKTEATEKPTEKTRKKVEAPARKVEREPKAARPKKLPHRVIQYGNRIHLTGTDVSVRDIPQSEWAQYGLKSMAGIVGGPCTEETVLTFKSPRAAATFFKSAFEAAGDEEHPETIVTGTLADWHSENLEEAANALGNG